MNCECAIFPQRKKYCPAWFVGSCLIGFETVGHDAPLSEAGAAGGFSPRRNVALSPGTRLIREWNGRTIAVEVREDGFVWEDRTYRSLSEIARAVTGAHWSGPRFFGLNLRG